jgi:hypothetical protein
LRWLQSIFIISKQAEMNQHTSYATATKFEVFQSDRAAAAQLGADGCQAGRTGSCGRGAHIAVIADDDRERRTECLRSREIASR